MPLLEGILIGKRCVLNSPAQWQPSFIIYKKKKKKKKKVCAQLDRSAVEIFI